ncbi:DeoR/GlpR family DNA-binding transcription regulator [Streptomyces johnsoniae]|uniref:DeoR/GlpR family DNA-binding transcription regulator n=1 Tax=Streptomyces johnsoniae TaxID=3075532 RepID=A0ABU2S7F4_9ACTN|nr:DeoR/GlpR family DNA-binding transcription regulator [Streptomyces sp. DSM 41886]MDT0444601.1 DeoR/GlpR family DNA-binding transcription regulator [Streptomyces sp. DSM 41886]
MMNGAARRREIRDLLRVGPIAVAELSERYNVSESTIRRDLARLSESGEIVRTYGGALSSNTAEEQPLREREQLAGAEKAAIARTAEPHAAECRLVLLDAGTTVGALAGRLAARGGLTVATTGLTSINILAGVPGIELIVLGGTVRQLSLGMVGPLAESAVSRLTADAAFLGADGVVAGRGICEARPEQTALKQLMIDRSREVCVLADSGKLGRANSHWWATFDRRWTLITDASATEEQLRPFHADPLCTVEVAAP